MIFQSENAELFIEDRHRTFDAIAALGQLCLPVTIQTGENVNRLNQVLDELNAEGDRLENQLKQVRSAIAALQGISRNGQRSRNRSHRTMSASARRRIAAAQKARWAKWKAAQKKKKTNA